MPHIPATAVLGDVLLERRRYTCGGVENLSMLALPFFFFFFFFFFPIKNIYPPPSTNLVAVPAGVVDTADVADIVAGRDLTVGDELVGQGTGDVTEGLITGLSDGAGLLGKERGRGGPVDGLLTLSHELGVLPLLRGAGLPDLVGKGRRGHGLRLADVAHDTGLGGPDMDTDLGPGLGGAGTLTTNFLGNVRDGPGASRLNADGVGATLDESPALVTPEDTPAGYIYIYVFSTKERKKE